MKRRASRCVLLICLLSCWSVPARAQIRQGEIQGTVINKDSGLPLAGVTVVVSGPAIQGDQTEATNQSGKYRITQLPPGDDYVVRFYFNDVVMERPGIRLTQDHTLTISVSMPPRLGPPHAYVIQESAPNVDIGSSGSATTIDQESLRKLPLRGRTIDSALVIPGGSVLAPDGAGGDVGISLSGATGSENTYLIDGLNTTNPNYGQSGTPLHHHFVKEYNIITGGYQAELGRATGGIISAVTKSGSNELHGSGFAIWAPSQLDPATISRLGEALAQRRRVSSEYDFGFDLGGPIIKDRIWFYVGAAPIFRTFTTQRLVRLSLNDRMEASCPSYLSDLRLCRGQYPGSSTRELAGTDLDETQLRINWVAKLQFSLHPDHNIQLSYIGTRERVEGYSGFLDGMYTGSVDAGSLRILGDLSAAQHIQQGAVHDFVARYTGKLLAHRLQLDVLYGYHRQEEIDRPALLDRPLTIYLASAANPYSLADFEPIPECVRDGTRNPCPITQYYANGYGRYINQELERHAVQASGTYFLQRLGSHAIKLGLDFEDLRSDSRRFATGVSDPTGPWWAQAPAIFETSPDGIRLQVLRQWGVPGSLGAMAAPDFRSMTETRNYAIYLRDNWVVSFLPGLVMNLGLRWDAQELYAATSSAPYLAVYDNWAPRLGAAYDFTRKGRSRLSLNYGRYYSTIPLDVNRIFSGEGFLATNPADGCATRTVTNKAGMPVRQIPLPSGCPWPQPSLAELQAFAVGVAPGLKGQYQDEVVAGFQYDVGLDLVLGVTYTYRALGSVVEDISVDNVNYLLIANPGHAADPDQVARLMAQISQTQDLAARMVLESVLTTYRAAASFPRPRRDYNGVTLWASKRLSNRFALQASYTYSRTIGNYPGTYASNNGQLAPNNSTQFDQLELLVNRSGPLPTDRPHNVKVAGFYRQPVGRSGLLCVGAVFTGWSGRPIEVLGAHFSIGAREVFILPRGSGGRTPFITQLDLSLRYDHRFAKVGLGLSLDIINVLNHRGITNVDDEYTASMVLPIRGGTIEDLGKLRALDGTRPVVNSNYGQPTGYQAPLFARLGASLSF